MADQYTPHQQGSQRYLAQVARNNYSSLVDTLNSGGRPEQARQCAELAVRQGVWDHPLQRDRDHLPGLRAQPLHDPSQFWFVGYLQERFPEIQAEIQGVLARAEHPVRETIQDHWLLQSGTWQQAYLFREGSWKEDVCAHFPVTRSVLAEIPEVTTFSPGVIMVSRLSPGTHITPHCGSTNAVLRVHLGITVPDGCRIRVADRTVRWQEGHCLVFDDSFEHEVWHEGSSDRVVLIFDMAHPDLDDAHRQRLLDNSPTPEERIVAFMRDRNLAGISIRDGEIVFTPNPAMHALVTRYMDATGVRGAQLTGDEFHWLS